MALDTRPNAGRGEAPSLTSRERRVPPLVLVFGIAGLAIAVAAVGAFLVGGEWDLLKVGEESNLPTWFSSIQLFVIALVLATIALRDIERHRPETWTLAAVPLLFGFLSLDEVAMLHERIGNLIQAETGLGSGWRTGPWMFFFLPLVGLLAVVAAWQFWPYLRGRREAIGLFGVGLAVLVFAAVGLEFTANFVAEGSLAHKGLGFAEEYGEMVAATLMLWGALVVARSEGIRLESGTPRRTEEEPVGASNAGEAS